MNNNILFSQDGGFQPPPPPPSYSGGTQYTPQDKSSQGAIWALILGIASWVACGIIAAIPAWIIGKKELNAIAEGRSSASGKTMAQIGMWLGIIQVILAIIAIFVILIIVVIGIISGSN